MSAMTKREERHTASCLRRVPLVPYHAVAEEGVPFKDIAVLSAAGSRCRSSSRLKKKQPSTSAGSHTLPHTTSQPRTHEREQLEGWQPGGPGPHSDLDRHNYFDT
jgi:hypothetical protein